MAIAFDAASSFIGCNLSSYSWSHTCTGADRFLFVGVGTSAVTPATTSSVTYAAVAMTEQWDFNDAANAHNSGHYRVAPATGANTIAVTLSAIQDEVSGGGTSATGVHQTTPIGTQVTASGDSTTPTVNVSSATDELVVDNMYQSGLTTTITVGAGQTQRWNNADVCGGFGGSAGSTEPGAATVTMSWTLGAASPWTIGALPFKPVLGVASGSGFPFQMMMTGCGS